MKALLWMLLFLAFPESGAGADAPGNGLHAIAQSGSAVITTDGTRVHLGKQLGDTISKVVVRSTSNANEQYYLSLARRGAFSRDYRDMVLCVEGHCVTFNSAGTSNNEICTTGAHFSSPATAQAFARFFGVALKTRAHAGYAFTTRFIPSKATFSTADALPVTLEIKNAGLIPCRSRRDRTVGRNNFIRPSGCMLVHMVQAPKLSTGRPMIRPVGLDWADGADPHGARWPNPRWGRLALK
jgi:hypothetical protein